MKCPKCQSEILDDSRFCRNCGTPIHPSEDALLSETQTILRPMEEAPTGTLVAGKYRILEVLGRGGMGIVYKAEDTKLKRPVALKFLPPELVRYREARERFTLEARAAAALSHPNICTIHEIHDEEEKPFISMEYVEGQSLKARVQEGPLEASEALEIAIQVAEGLEEAHRKGIIHRDIKSANIMVTGPASGRPGQAKIMDFGLAKVRGETLFTRVGTTLGTVAYMSPEQARAEEVDHRTDLWSLGVVLYEILSGRLPFTGDREAPILYSIVHEEPKPLKALKPGLPPELHQIVNRALKKNPDARYPSAAEMLKDLRKYRDSLKAEELRLLTPRAFLRLLRKPKVALPTAACLVAIAAAAVWFSYRQSKIRWAREKALPEIERLVTGHEVGYSNFSRAYRLAEEAERYIPSDPALSWLLERCSANIAVKTEPPGAAVYIKEPSAPDQQWKRLGVSPIHKVRVPAACFWWKIEKEGYETVMAVMPTFQRDDRTNTLVAPYNLSRVLDQKTKIPPGMVRVPGAETPAGRLNDFFIDRYEVTNKQYKEFVNAGGYRDRRYWKHKFVKEGRVLTWDQAIAEFVDQTGRPGPSIWSAGDFPKGQEDYPVSGVSWYEPAAYAEFVGKSLPTQSHWGVATGERTPLFQIGSISWLAQVSNFSGEGPARVGTYQGMTAYGAYDMAGNVREWCWNETRSGRIIRGGAWNDATYMVSDFSQAPAFDRSPKNGFRCALYIDPEKVPEKAFQPYLAPEGPDFYKLKPVPDSVFQVYREQFSYDKKELNARVEWRNESASDWIQEKVTFDAVYGNERIPAYLFLPKNTPPPHPTVIYFPGSGSVSQRSSKDLDRYWEFVHRLSFIVKSGRAALYPVYKGTFERRDEASRSGADTRQYTEYLIQVIKDFKRSIDYLETRPDIDSKKLAYLGFSWGGWLGPIIPAVEERLRASIAALGGFPATGRPEVHGINYVTRVKVPTLMLNGRYDMSFPFETSVKPMFDLLGTPAEHKKLRLYDTDHFIPQNELIKETLAWLDRYLGPVK